jgi:hypothetical protein
MYLGDDPRIIRTVISYQGEIRKGIDDQAGCQVPGEELRSFRAVISYQG